MKKIIFTLMLFVGAFGYSGAQTMYDLYTGYQIYNSEDKSGDVFRCESQMNMVFGYTNWSFNNKAPQAEMFGAPTGRLATLHGFSYSSDYLMPVWGPFGIAFNWLDFSFGMGKWDTEYLKTGVPSNKTSDPIHISMGLGIMPTFCINAGRVFSMHLFGGVKGYLTFMDGPNSYPLNSTKEKTRPSIANIAYANAIAGVDLLFGDFGLRFSYQWGFTQRMKKQFYGYGDTETAQKIQESNPMHWTKEMYNPRYDMFTVALIYKFDL